MKGNRVRLNVGGKKFETTATTLAVAGSDSFFGPLLSNNWNTNTTDEDDNEVVFIDRNPDCFAVILDLLRTGELSIPPHVGKDSLIREAQFYGVLELVRAATWGSPLNGDFIVPSCSITCRARKSAAKRIFGSPNGGFCVLSEKSVYVYDWMLHEHPPIHLDDGEVNDILWVGTNNIAIATTKSVGMFDAVTGKLRYKFVNQKGNQVRGAISMCLIDSNIFHLYQNHVAAVGVLDCESGKSMETLYLRFPTYLWGFDYNPTDLSRPINLQRVDGGSGKCLLATYVVIRHPDRYKGEYFEAQIIDTTDRHSVANGRYWSSRDYRMNGDWKTKCATLMEDRNSICVISTDGRIGFLDLKFTEDVQWCPKDHVAGYTSRKLMYHNDRIFTLWSKKQLSVYSVPDLVMTSNIPEIDFDEKPVFEVDDFSISGERLFMMQSRTNVVDVWETPRPCLSFL